MKSWKSRANISGRQIILGPIAGGRMILNIEVKNGGSSQVDKPLG